MQYTGIFSAVKKFTRKNDIFNILLKTYIVGTRGGSNEYPQCMVWIKNKEIRYTPAYPSFTI